MNIEHTQFYFSKTEGKLWSL